MDEDIAGHAGDVLLDESVAIDEVVDAIRREDVLELEAVDARGVGLFDVKVIGVVVVEVGDANTERFGISKISEVDAIHTKVFVQSALTANF